MKIKHYRDRCIACYKCEIEAPSDWKMDEEGDGLANLIGAEEVEKGVFVKTIKDKDIEANKKAIEECPVDIIEEVKE